MKTYRINVKLHTSIEAIYDLVPSFDDPKKSQIATVRIPHNTMPKHEIIVPTMVRTIPSANPPAITQSRAEIVSTTRMTTTSKSVVTENQNTMSGMFRNI